MSGKTQSGLSDFSDVPHHDTALGTYVSLYAGAGGMDLGFALAGFRPVWVNELDHHACATHNAVFRSLWESRQYIGSGWATHCADITGLPDEDLPSRGSADLVIGGPPCQGFSVAGKMDPDDPRSQHVFHFLDVVERVQPRAFVLENVKSLFLSRRWEAVRERLTLRAQDLGYGTEFYLCNASHFGVPQARERMFFIGILNGTPVAPLTTTADNPPTVRQALAQLPRVGNIGNDSTCGAKVTPAKSPVMRLSPFAGMMLNGAGRPMDLDAPAPTLPASMGGNKTPIIDQDQLDLGVDPWIVEYHSRLQKGGAPLERVPQRMRRITVQEAAAIQTFPLGMKWHGPQSAQYRQIGNAVPPRLALAVARAVSVALEQQPTHTQR